MNALRIMLFLTLNIKADAAECLFGINLKYSILSLKPRRDRNIIRRH